MAKKVWFKRISAITLAAAISLSVTGCQSLPEGSSESAKEALSHLQEIMNDYANEAIESYLPAIEEAVESYLNNGTDNATTSTSSFYSGDPATLGAITKAPCTVADIPAYTGANYVAINGNVPYFTEEEKAITTAFEYYGELDSLKRCTIAYMNANYSLMPTEKRDSIGSVKPSGWHTVRYDDRISDKYLYNRCHLLAFMISGENANPLNLITGTRAMNLNMLDHENIVADYVRTHKDNHVLYRVTPLFDGLNLVANGVLMEAYSVEDQGKGVEFCVFYYNVQPGVIIDYTTGDSVADPNWAMCKF